MNKNNINRYTLVSKISPLFCTLFSRRRIKYVDLSDFYSHNEMIWLDDSSSYENSISIFRECLYHW